MLLFETCERELNVGALLACVPDHEGDESDADDGEDAENGYQAESIQLWKSRELIGAAIVQTHFRSKHCKQIPSLGDYRWLSLIVV